MAGDRVRLGLLGCGVVGSATARILVENAHEIESRSGVPVELARVAIRDTSKKRDAFVSPGLVTDDPWDVVKDPSIDLVVEVIGGIEPARDLVLAAIGSGKHVVTANKELLANEASTVMKAASKAGVKVLFEASVAGGTPIVRPMTESLAGDRVRRIMGILNGTTNFVLTRMSESGESFADALAEAAERGYTELDPSADIEGHDAAAKLAILASIAFDAAVVSGDVGCEGIANVTARDMAAAHDLGYEIKLLAVAERHGDEVAARVHPAMMPRTHPLASVRNELNAIFVEAEHAGELMFLGRGAGGPATASAIVGDIVEIVRDRGAPAAYPGAAALERRARIQPAGDVASRYYVVLSVADRPGVLASVAGAFARHGVSIASVRQEGFGDEATLVLITHSASEAQHAATFSELETLEPVRRLRSRMRVLGTAEV
jgi:homoserine dehydrogenase